MHVCLSFLYVAASIFMLYNVHYTWQPHHGEHTSKRRYRDSGELKPAVCEAALTMITRLHILYRGMQIEDADVRQSGNEECSQESKMARL